MAKDIAPTVLILDDDAGITELLSDILQQEGYQVFVFNSPKDVLYLARQSLPDLLLLDIMMPEIDGYDVCKFFKEDPELRFTRIIVLSARDSHDSRLKCYQAGADVFLAKPFEIEELREVVRNHIQSKQLYDQKLEKMALDRMVDEVTDCYTWNCMERRVQDELKRVERHRRPLSLLLLDLDQFKNVNVRHGFAFGNEVLRTVADSLRRNVRESDVVGRYMKDAFVVVLPETGTAGAKTMANRLQNVVASLTFPQKKRFSLHATVVQATIEANTNPSVVLSMLEERLRKAQARKLGKG